MSNFQTKPILCVKALLPLCLYYIKEDSEKDPEKDAQLVKGKRKQEHQALTLILAIFSLEYAPFLPVRLPTRGYHPQHY